MPSPPAKERITNVMRIGQRVDLEPAAEAAGDAGDHAVGARAHPAAVAGVVRGRGRVLGSRLLLGRGRGRGGHGRHCGGPRPSPPSELPYQGNPEASGAQGASARRRGGPPSCGSPRRAAPARSRSPGRSSAAAAAAPPGAPPNTALTLTVPTSSSRQARCALAADGRQHDRGEAELAAVGLLQRRVEGVDDAHRGHRAERLLGEHGRVAGRPDEHGRRVEAAGAVRDLPAGEERARRCGPRPPRGCGPSRAGPRRSAGPSPSPGRGRRRPSAPRARRVSAARNGSATSRCT